MPSLQYWFTGGALAAFLALVAALSTLGYSWYRAAITEMQLLEVRQRTANRDLSPEETKALSEQLARFAGQPAKIVIFPVNIESVGIAQAVYGILLNAHWNVEPPENLLNPPGVGFMVQGIWVDHSNDDASKEAASAVRLALNSTVAKASGTAEGPTMLKGVFDATKPLVWILVGDKPTPLRSWVTQ